jgi:hypothetical protein
MRVFDLSRAFTGAVPYGCACLLRRCRAVIALAVSVLAGRPILEFACLA